MLHPPGEEDWGSDMARRELERAAWDEQQRASTLSVLRSQQASFEEQAPWLRSSRGADVRRMR